MKKSDNAEEVKKEEVKYWESPVDETSKHGYFVRASKDYMSQGYQGLDLVAKLDEWSQKYCNPPFTNDEIKVYVQFFLQQEKPENQNTKQTKVTKIYDVVKTLPGLYLFRDQNEVPHAQVKIGSRNVIWEVSSQNLVQHIRQQVFEQMGQSTTDLQIKEVTGLLALHALYKGEQHPVFNRVTQKDGVFYYDLNNPDGQVVVISDGGQVVKRREEVPVFFKAGLGREQVYPTRGGDLKKFLRFVNIPDEDEQILFLCTLPVRLIRDIEQAIGYIHGPAGSGKTTLLKMVKDLLDPSVGGVSIPVRRYEDILPVLNKTWVFCNDNISKMPDDLSDFFCTMATGGESNYRKLYSNDEVHTFSVKNPAYVTGINVEASKSDLLSRVILFKTEAVTGLNRQSGSDLVREFEEVKSELVGALFDTLSSAILVRKMIELKTESRLADFAIWGAACAEVLGYGHKRFEQAITRAIKNRAYDALYATSAGRALLGYMKENDSFKGSAGELLTALKKARDNSNEDDWHEAVAYNPSSLGKRLRELENSLLEVGIMVDFDYRTAQRRIIQIKTTETWRQNCEANSSDSNDGSF